MFNKKNKLIFLNSLLNFDFKKYSFIRKKITKNGIINSKNKIVKYKIIHNLDAIRQEETNCVDYELGELAEFDEAGMENESFDVTQASVHLRLVSMYLSALVHSSNEFNWHLMLYMEPFLSSNLC